MANANWSATSLGPFERWPASLRAIAITSMESPVAVCLLCGRDRLRIYNDAFAVLLGDDHPASFGQPARDDSLTTLSLAGDVIDAAFNGQSMAFEGCEFHRRIDGLPEDGWCDVLLTPVRDAISEVAAVLVTVFETTAKVRRADELEAEKAAVLQANSGLAAETALLRGFFQQAPSFMAVLRGPDFVFELNNDSFLRLIGRVDVVGKPVAKALPELVHQPLRKLLDSVYETNEAFVGREMSVMLQRLPGRVPEERLIDVVLQPIAPAAGSLGGDAERGIFVEGTDVTQRMRAEAALRRLNETLEDAVEARTAELREAEEALRQAQKMETVGQLTGGIAHDFNNLLGAILGGLELMRVRLATGQLDELPRYIEAATSSANRAAALTHRLLAFSRRQTLDPRPTDVGRLVAAMGDLIGRTVGPAIHTESHTARELWTALCDNNQLEVSLLNLAVNARDAMPGGGTLVIEAANIVLGADDADRQPDTEAGRYVAISVRDTGIGMSQTTADRAFEPFFTTKPAGHGTGLGLSMVYGFAKQSGGQVKMESRPGRGTKVTIFLPWCAAPADPPPIAPQDPRPPTFGGERVLIVDDEPVLRGLVVEITRELGYQVTDAGSGEEALQLLQSDPSIELLITDVGMPDMNGRQLADAAREICPYLRVLFITGYVDNAVLSGSLVEAGMHVLTKPFTKAALAQKIQATMGTG